MSPLALIKRHDDAGRRRVTGRHPREYIDFFFSLSNSHARAFTENPTNRARTRKLSLRDWPTGNGFRAGTLEQFSPALRSLHSVRLWPTPSRDAAARASSAGYAAARPDSGALMRSATRPTLFQQQRRWQISCSLDSTSAVAFTWFSIIGICDARIYRVFQKELSKSLYKHVSYSLNLLLSINNL